MQEVICYCFTDYEPSALDLTSTVGRRNEREQEERSEGRKEERGYE